MWLQSRPGKPYIFRLSLYSSISNGSILNSSFLSDQDSFLLHLQNGDSFTELVDDLLALMSYIL